MVELRSEPDGRLSRFHGGDTLNTAVYLARLGVAVDYVTALGDDDWSDEMAAHWAAEGVGTDRVRRLAGREPGLYVIETDTAGERRFRYWRSAAAARSMFDGAGGEVLLASLARDGLLYISGITLSILAPPARDGLFQALGGRVAFDTNFRPRGWPDLDEARTTYRRAFRAASIVLASVEDLTLLFGEAWAPELDGVAELVLKDGMTATVRTPDATVRVDAAPIARVVDTTAAGDSFAAAYLAARLQDGTPEQAVHAGHRLAGIVVGHPGAIIPRDAMPQDTP